MIKSFLIAARAGTTGAPRFSQVGVAARFGQLPRRELREPHAAILGGELSADGEIAQADEGPSCGTPSHWGANGGDPAA